MATAALGLVLHFGIAYLWTAVYYLGYRRSASLQRLTSTRSGALLVGAALGVIWLVMDLVVLPLSAARPTPPSSPFFWILLLGHAVVVGSPIALLVRSRR